MNGLRTASRTCLGSATVIFILYLVERFSASSRVPMDVLTVPDLVMFPLLLFMSLLVGASFMIESHLASQ